MSAVTSSNVGPLKSKLGAHASQTIPEVRNLLGCLFLLLAVASATVSQSSESIVPGPKPGEVPQSWKPWIGEYGFSFNPIRYVLSEKDDYIWILERPNDNPNATYKIVEKFPIHTTPPTGPANGLRLHFSADGRRVLVMGDVGNVKRSPDQDRQSPAVAESALSVENLRSEALNAAPPLEKEHFRAPDLVELISLDPSIHLDIRYATSNDFLGVPVYTQARAFLQRPAAVALLRVLQKLKPLGYGLLIHDGYRPWYVTKIFWDATPPEGKIFVADPAKGSRHNRGCAVDLTLYDLKTGAPVEMTGFYDEMSPRSFPDYPGGTSLQRWHRDLLRRAMESEGFTVYESEWWHFDYKDWPEYGILNIPFEKLGTGSDQK
jgi:D-alanyl-D-alanine dipeptidase